MHQENSFITLTYRKECLPKGGTLVKAHFQKFLKRLRFDLGTKKVRYFHCGEYGENLGRPHYHALIFGHGFGDRVLWTVDKRSKIPLYRSPQLERLWTDGFSTVGECNFETAAYVARYCVKKVTGQAASEHYKDRLPEYTTMSRNRGIGHSWYQQFKREVYPQDSVVIRGKQMQPPKYYQNLYELEEPEELEQLVKVRREKRNKENNTLARLRTREVVKQAQNSMLKRGYENQ